MGRIKGERTEGVCAWCGKKFSYLRRNNARQYCDDCTNSKERKNAMQNVRRREQEKRRKPREGPLSLDEKIREATRLHLSYGKYMALLGRRPH